MVSALCYPRGSARGSVNDHHKKGVTTLPIGTAVKRGAYVYVYDEKGRQLMTISTGSKLEDGLMGYTSTTVSVRRGGFIYTYDEKGRQISTHSAR